MNISVEPKTLFREAPKAEFDVPIVIIERWQGWLCVALALLVAFGVYWAFFSTIVTVATATGLLSQQAGTTQAVVTLTGGTPTAIVVRPGEWVRAGQPIAYLDQPDKEQDLRSTLSTINVLEAQRAHEVKFYSDLIAKNQAIQTRESANYQKSMSAAQQSMETLGHLVTAYKNLMASGAASQADVDVYNEKYHQTETLIAEISNASLQLEITAATVENERDAALNDLDQKISTAVAHKEDVAYDLKIGGVIKSPVSGRVATIEAELNTNLPAGGTIVNLSLQNGKLVALTFVSPSDAKSVHPGSIATVSPNNIHPEEYGSILGTVTSVGQIPESGPSLMRTLNNQQEVNQILTLGAPILAVVALQEDSNTPTGFRWTSGSGPPGSLSLSTPVTTTINEREQAPITLLLPTLKKFTGLYR